MLRVTKQKKIIRLSEAQNKIRKKKALFIITNSTEQDTEKLEGYIQCISDTRDSFSELIEEYGKVKKNNQQAIVIGSYEDGGAIGVQYETR